MNIILFGFKKCGKTYYGLQLAKKLHMHFVDTDLMIEELYTKIHHQTLPYRDIAKKHGFAFFRNLEKHAVAQLAQEKSSIISLGGGVLLDQENVERLQKIGLLVYLKTPKDILKHRLLSQDPPAFFDPDHLSESFENLYKERLPIYESIPSHVIDTQNRGEEEILQMLIAFVTEQKRKSYGE